MGDFAQIFYPTAWAENGIQSFADMHLRCVEWATTYRSDVDRMHRTAAVAERTRAIGVWCAGVWMSFFAWITLGWTGLIPLPMVVLLIFGSAVACASLWNAARCHELAVRARAAARDLAARAAEWDAHAALVYRLMDRDGGTA